MTWVSNKVLTALNVLVEGRGIDAAGIARMSGVKDKSLENALAKLRRSAFIELVDGGLYRITDAGRAFVAAGKRLTSGPRGTQHGHRLWRKSLRQRAWHAMRLRRKFTVEDILLRAAEAGDLDAETNLGKFLRALVAAGYLTVLSRTKDANAPTTSNGVKRYLLVRDSGPRAPVWSDKRGSMYDPNTDEEHKPRAPGRPA
jgi:hypothetical protein